MTDRDYEFSSSSLESERKPSPSLEYGGSKSEQIPSQKFAFPFSIDERFGKTVTHHGMSLRDWFAGKALSGIVAGYLGNDCMSGLSRSDIAESAYQYADAMMEK